MTQEWLHRYQMRPYFRNVGISVVLFSGGMTIVSLIGWFNQAPNDPVNMPLVVAFFFLFSWLGIYLFFLHARYCLLIGDSTVRQTGVFGVQQVDLSSVIELKWRCFPEGGSVVLKERTSSLSIELGNFEQKDRQNVIEFLRRNIADSRQTGRQPFDETFSDTPEKKRMSIRIHFILVLIFVVHAVVFGVLWASGAGLVFLFCGGLNAIGAAYLWSSYRPKSTHCGESRGHDV